MAIGAIVNELQELHPDKALALRIERGEVSREEVNRVWAETRDLSAQTPFETRRAVVELRKIGSLNDAWPVFFTQMMEMMSQMQGAMTKDESKFAHLIAGAESIVKTMQNLNPLAERLETMTRMMFEMRGEIRELRAEREEKKVALEEEVPRADGVRRADVDIDDEEGRAQQARKDSIGSAWAK